MSETLYSRDVLRLAASLLPADLEQGSPDTPQIRSALCGSVARARCSRDDDGRITTVDFTLKACALGQASASLLQRAAVGLNQSDLAALRTEVKQMLADGATEPAGWEALAPAREHPARHGAILLPFDALLAALSATSLPGTSV